MANGKDHRDHRDRKDNDDQQRRLLAGALSDGSWFGAGGSILVV
jgi:hypothetical protein